MYRVASTSSLRPLQIAWIAATVLSCTAGMMLVGMVRDLMTRPNVLVLYLLSIPLAALVGLAQMGAVYWWQRGAGRPVFDDATALWWIGTWALGGLVSFLGNAVDRYAAGFLLGFIVVPLAQARLLRSWSWSKASVLGLIGGSLVGLMILLVLWDTFSSDFRLVRLSGSSPVFPIHEWLLDWRSFAQWAPCALPYAIATSLVLRRIVSERWSVAQR